MKRIDFLWLLMAAILSFAEANAQSGWYRQDVPSDGGLLAVHLIDAQNGAVVGGESDSLGIVHPLILWTTNGGASWSRHLLPVEGGLSGVSLTGMESATAVGWLGQLIWINEASGPLIIHTTDGGSTWTSQLGDSGYTLNSVCFTDVNTGTAVGWDGVHGGGRILRTTDGGNSWTHQFSGTGNCLRSVCFTDRLMGTIVGWGGTILRTTDGGTSWVPQLGQTGDGYESVSFTDANTGTVVGGHTFKPGFGPAPLILHTIDGGTTWTQSSGTITALPYGISFGDAMTGTAVGGGARGAGAVLAHANGARRSANEANSLIMAIRALEIQGGRPSSSMAQVAISGMYRDSVIFRTTDGGATWTPQSTGAIGSLSTELNAVSFSDGNHGTAVGAELDSLGNWHPLILRTTTGGVVSAVGCREGEMPQRILLFQNYPNPFNPTTVISYQLPVVSNIRLAVFDLLGREVAVLVNERKNAGSYEVRFDAAGLSSGVYFYKLESDVYAGAKKFVLLK